MSNKDFYIGFKLVGIPNVLWFKENEVALDCGRYTATNGWGRSGSYVQKAEFREASVEYSVKSEILMY